MTTPARTSSLLGRLLRDEDGNVGPILALLLLPISGLMALAGEFGYANLAQRNQQHAADSAALAAAANDDSTLQGTLPRYEVEAKAVAARYNIGDASVNVQKEQLCPGETTLPGTCYQVTISRLTPFWLAGAVGFDGVTENGKRGIKVVATSKAKTRVTPVSYCAMALEGGITMDGTSEGWDDCNVRAKGEVKCTAVKFYHVYAGSTKACGTVPFTAMDDDAADPYDYLHLDDTIADAKDKTSCSNINSLSWASWNGIQVARVCNATQGKLTGPVKLPKDGVLLVDGNFSINLQSTLTGAGGNAIVFTGSLASDWFSGGGSVTLAGPTTGPFANFVLVDDPSITTAKAGPPKKSPDINILGTIYAPHRDLSFDGPIRSDVGGYSCLAILANSVSSNGGKFPKKSLTDCTSLGYSQVTGTPVREALVQ